MRHCCVFTNFCTLAWTGFVAKQTQHGRAVGEHTKPTLTERKRGENVRKSGLGSEDVCIQHDYKLIIKVHKMTINAL